MCVERTKIDLVIQESLWGMKSETRGAVRCSISYKQVETILCHKMDEDVCGSSSDAVL